MQVESIREHMEVVGVDGDHVGKVDHVLGHEIQLTKAMGLGKHHYIPISWVQAVDDKVRLSMTADDAKMRWRGEA